MSYTSPPRLADVTADARIEQRSLDFVKYLSCLAMTTRNDYAAAVRIFEDRYIHHAAVNGFLPSESLRLVEKAAVAAGTTTDATWAGPLAPVTPLVSAFLAFMRPLTILGKLDAVRSVPANVSVATQTGAGVYQWIGQGAPTPATALALATTTIGVTKCGGVIVITDELARMSSPDAAVVVRGDLAAGIAAFLDVEFVNPA